MNNSPIQTPKNTTKRTGIGCSAIGLLLFITAICVFVTGLILKLEHTYIAIGWNAFGFWDSWFDRWDWFVFQRQTG